MADRWWRWPAVAGLLVVLVQALIRRGDGTGGDSAYYLANARDLTMESRYPPGMAFLLAPVASLGPAHVVMILVTMALATAIWWAAIKVGGWPAGVFAAALLHLAPVIWSNSTVMSDRPAALFVVLALLALLYGRPALAGVLAAGSGWIRLVHVAFCVALPRRAWIAAGIALGLLGAWQLVMQGSLIGYSSGEASFALDNVTGPVWTEVVGNPAKISNFEYLTLQLTTGFGEYFAPLAIIPAACGLWRWRRSDGARFAAGTALLCWLVHLPYFAQSARFILPAACVLSVYAAAMLARWVMDPLDRIVESNGIDAPDDARWATAVDLVRPSGATSSS